MSNFKINGNINATNVHNGDNYYYNSPQDFLKENEKLEFSKTERELVEIIFQNTNSDAEREEILKSLKSIKEEPEKDSVKYQSGSNVISSFLTNIGTSLASKLIADLGFTFIKENT